MDSHSNTGVEMQASNLIRSSLADYIPKRLRPLGDLQKRLPEIAASPEEMRLIHDAVLQVPSHHVLRLGDARKMRDMNPESIHLVVTSPPYWTLKRYRDSDGQLGHVVDYHKFLDQLDQVWRSCLEALVPGGRLICVVGDVCLSRRKNNGRHEVVPLHSSIQERCRLMGYANLSPIIWHKIANASYEVENGGGFLGKPYEPNAVIKNDIEYILMLRKPGGYRKPTPAERVLSVISVSDYRSWFRQIWSDIAGASTKNHPAPYPLQLAERLIRMFSFVGDVVLDPFMGSGTTNLAAANYGRSSIGIEVDKEYFAYASTRISRETQDLFGGVSISIESGDREKLVGHRPTPEKGDQGILENS